MNDFNEIKRRIKSMSDDYIHIGREDALPIPKKSINNIKKSNIERLGNKKFKFIEEDYSTWDLNNEEWQITENIKSYMKRLPQGFTKLYQIPSEGYLKEIYKELDLISKN